MRKFLVAAFAAAFVVGTPVAVLAASGTFSSSLTTQESRWTTTATTTQSATFQFIPALGRNICAVHQVTATLSVQLRGAPAGFQIRVDGGGLMQPGAIRFVPAGDHASMSFTFVSSVGTFEANDRHDFVVEWRSANGAATTLERGTLNLQYQRGTHC